MRQRGQRVGAALIQRPGIRGAHLLGKVRESPVEGRRGRGGDGAVDLGHPIVEGVDSNVPVLLGGLTTLTRGVGVGGAHRGVDGVDDPLLRPSLPVADACGQRLVELGNQPVVGNEIGTGDDQSHCAPIGAPLGQQGRNLGNLLSSASAYETR